MLETNDPNLSDSLILETKSIAKQAVAELEESILTALLTYANVHRGNGHFSQVTTRLYEKAREIVLDYIQPLWSAKEYSPIKADRQLVIFMSPLRAQSFIKDLKNGTYYMLSSNEFGLPLGITAIAVSKNDLPAGVPFQSGGGTTKLTSRNWVIWADAPDKFEAGTPSIINVIAFARALQLCSRYGKDIFLNTSADKLTVFELLYKDNYGNLEGEELLKTLRNDLIGKNTEVPVSENKRHFINLDNSASTQAFQPVWETYRNTLWQPEEIKPILINEVKAICSSFLSASKSDYEVIFTSNTTESINLVAESFRKMQDGNNTVIVTSILEHSSNDLPWRFIQGSTIVRIDVDQNGFFDLQELENLLQGYNKDNKFGSKRIKLVALTGASNVLGVCNNLKEVRRITKQYGVQLLIDAAQLVAHRKISLNEIDAEYMAFSAHKIYAPFGCGVLIARKGLLNFNDAEKNAIKASGEENVSGIAALGKALLLIDKVGMDIIAKDEIMLTSMAVNRMKEIKGLKIHGMSNPEEACFNHKAGVIAFTLGNKIATSVARDLAFYGGIGVRSGCHCAHLIVKRLAGVKPFLENFQWAIQKAFPKIKLPGVLRASFGIGTTEEEINELIRTLQLINGKTKTYKVNDKEVRKSINKFIQQIENKVFA